MKICFFHISNLAVWRSFVIIVTNIAAYCILFELLHNKYFEKVYLQLIGYKLITLKFKLCIVLVGF